MQKQKFFDVILKKTVLVFGVPQKFFYEKCRQPKKVKNHCNRERENYGVAPIKPKSLTFIYKSISQVLFVSKIVQPNKRLITNLEGQLCSKTLKT